MRAIVMVLAAATAAWAQPFPGAADSVVPDPIPAAWIEPIAADLGDEAGAGLRTSHGAYLERYRAIARPAKEEAVETWGEGDPSGQFGQFIKFERLMTLRERAIRSLGGVDGAFLDEASTVMTPATFDLLRARRELAVRASRLGSQPEATVDLIGLLAWEDVRDEDAARFFAAYAWRMADAARAQLDEVADTISGAAEVVREWNALDPADRPNVGFLSERLQPVLFEHIEEIRDRTRRLVRINREAVARAPEVLGLERGAALRRAYWCAAFDEWFPCDDPWLALLDERLAGVPGSAEVRDWYLRERDALCAAAIEEEQALRDAHWSDVEENIPAEEAEARDRRLETHREALDDLGRRALERAGAP